MLCGKVTWRVALTLALLLLGGVAQARGDFVYNITIDTSSLSGGGFLDLQFDPTGGTGVLTATVQTLATNNLTLGSLASWSGNVTGPGSTTPPSGLPLTFTADNTNGPQTNEAFWNVTNFGTQLALSLDIAPADANSTASFFLTLFDAGGTPLFPNSGGTGATPAAVEIDLTPNPSGSSPNVSILPLDPSVQATPEGIATPAPPTVVLLGISLACFACYGLIRRKQRPAVA
jgi:hypothetical protein